MLFEQVYESARTECGHLKDRDWINIYVSSLMSNGNAKGVFHRLQEGLEEIGINASVIQTGSFGYYDLEPVVVIEKVGQLSVVFKNVTAETASELLRDNLNRETSRSDLTSSETLALPFFDLQKRIALRNCGFIDPENINHYIYLKGGYSGLSKALTMSREAVIEGLKKSGLRGRGGAGFKTADKWRVCRNAEGSEKYAVCNAVDADPRSITAQLLLESDPHAVIEGLLIGAYAVDASKCTICVPREFNSTIERIGKAIEQLKPYGLIGNNVLDSPFSCELDFVAVEASLVAGEETALICALEGKKAMPFIRPPFPAVKGFNRKPMLVNNIETLANVSAVFQRGPEWFMEFGTKGSKGTKVITLSGDVNHKHTVEVEFGTSLQTIVDEFGGGIPKGKKLKAVQLGGPTAAYFAADSLGIGVDYETIGEADSIMGSGTLEVLSDDSCAVETCRDIVSYIHTQSCGKCVFCREGTYQIFEILSGISEQSGKSQDIDLLIELCDAMKIGCICGLGRTAPNPVLSSIRLFSDEYNYHIKEKKCRIQVKR
jgi:NADH-quinone oxidoreductase subunit F